MRVCLSIKSPWSKQEREGERGRDEERRKREIETKKKESGGHPSWWKCVYVCAFHILSIQTLIFAILMMFNSIQVIASLSRRRQYLRGEKREMWISSSNKSRDIILELLTNWCVLLVVIVCSSLLFFSFFTSYFFFQFMRHLMCACVCVPYVNLLCIRVCLIYYQHCHAGCWCLPQLVFVVRSFASTSITLHCEVLGVCQE